MFRYTIIAVGKLKSRPLASLCADYGKRLARSGSFGVVELKDGDVAGEGRRILEALDKRSGARIYVLSEEGRTCGSRDFAAELEALQGQPAVFVVGGPYGICPRVKERADRLLSLSPLTFTHEMARLLLCEQLYRAVAITSGSSYHHD